MKKIQILLIEENRLQRENISALLKKQSDMNVVSTVGNDENILGLIKKLKPDIVLLDPGLRSKNSLEVVKSIKKQFQETKIIVMDIVPLQSEALEFVQAGISGLMLKDINVKEFLKTIRSVYEGLKILPSNLTSTLFSQIVEKAINEFSPSAILKSVRMTKRELQVTALIADGSTNKEIAQKLKISTFTVKSHVHNILEKLTLSTRIQIAKYVNISNSEITGNETTSLPE